MKKTIRDYELRGKKVLLRCDFNVPMKDGEIKDDTRIRTSLKTIQYAIDNGAKVIIFSHLGRIKEESDLIKNDMTPIVQRLSNLLNKKIQFSQQTRGKNLEEAIDKLNDGDILVIQNTRYEDLVGKKESKNDTELGKYWASLGDIYINDAFGTAHRAHASNVGIASYLPNGIGFLIEKELLALERLHNPEHPYTVILGGSKVSDKIGVISHLAPLADHILIGGGMAFTFLRATGKEIGKSLLDEDSLDFCREILKQYKDKIVLPMDINVTEDFTEEAPNHVTTVDNIQSTEIGMDLGPSTIKQYQEILENSKTVLWNGPLGVYEMKKYQTATKELLNYLAHSNATTILGGGDIVAASTELGYKDKVAHASTGGGATLEYLEGKELPGLKVINERS